MQIPFGRWNDKVLRISRTWSFSSAGINFSCSKIPPILMIIQREKKLNKNRNDMAEKENKSEQSYVDYVYNFCIAKLLILDRNYMAKPRKCHHQYMPSVN